MAKAKPITGLNRYTSTAHNARIIARTRLEELYSWGSYVDNAYAIRELHNLRIAAKRLRYTLEVFEEVLPPASQSIRKELEQIQEELGVLHDSDVMIVLLQLCLSNHNQTVGPQFIAPQGSVELPLELMADLLYSPVPPTTEQCHGLAQLLHKRQQKREEQYRAFRQHWHQLQEQDFRHEVLSMLNT